MSDDRDLYLLLGRIEGSQESLTGEVRAGIRASDEGIRRLHGSIDDLRIRTEQQLKEMNDRNEEQFKSLSERISTAQRTAELATNQITAVSPTITEHQNLKLKAEGAALAAGQIGKMMWIFGSTVIAAILSGAAYVSHALFNVPKP